MKTINTQIKCEELDSPNAMLLVNTDEKSTEIFSITRQSFSQYSYYQRTGKWTEQQKYKMGHFIANHQEILQNKPFGKLWIIFSKMANFIKSRNVRQCKSYYQKLYQQKGNIANVIEYLLAKQKSISSKIIKTCVNSITCLSQEVKIKNQKKKPTQNVSIQTEQLNYRYDSQNLVTKKEDLIPTDTVYYPDNSSHSSIPNQANPQFFLQKNIQRVRQDRWKQCHLYYIAWTSRLKNIMQQGQRF